LKNRNSNSKNSFRPNKEKRGRGEGGGIQRERKKQKERGKSISKKKTPETTEKSLQDREHGTTPCPYKRRVHIKKGVRRKGSL